jgi:hemerythrin-like domain-containing protein
MMMKITDRLKVEHGVFLLQLRRLQEMSEKGASVEDLRATLETIATAEEWHSVLEDRLLYPALAETLGSDNEVLRDVAEDHRALRALADRVRSGEFTREDVLAYATRLRSHLEREIHGVFRLAEQRISAERLTGMCSWDAEHISAEAGKREEWLRSQE